MATVIRRANLHSLPTTFMLWRTWRALSLDAVWSTVALALFLPIVLWCALTGRWTSLHKAGTFPGRR